MLTLHRLVISLPAAFGVLVMACATTSPNVPVAETSTTVLSKGEPAATQQPGVCTLVCEAAQLVPHPADSPDYSAHELANANQVLEAMHGDLLACYTSRVAVNPQAHGFITVDIVIDSEGRVQTTKTTGGAVLGGTTMRCIVDRIKRATFEPPHGGGTLHVQVPFSLRRVTPDETL